MSVRELAPPVVETYSCTVGVVEERCEPQLRCVPFFTSWQFVHLKAASRTHYVNYLLF